LGIHCCATARHQWKNILKIPNLVLLNLNQPQEILTEAHVYFASHTAQMHIVDSWEPSAGAQQFPIQPHLVLQADTATRAEATGLVKSIRAHFKE
jgi:hypothetical protein